MTAAQNNVDTYWYAQPYSAINLAHATQNQAAVVQSKVSEVYTTLIKGYY